MALIWNSVGVEPHYDQDGRPMTPTTIGYEAAAFYRYRARLGADVESKIEFYPSSQWGELTCDLQTDLT